MRILKGGYLGGVLVLALACGGFTQASAEALNGTWKCTFTRGDKTTYNATIKLTPTTGQWGTQAPGALTLNGNQASFLTRLPSGTDGNTVSMTLSGNAVSARLSGTVAASNVRGAQNYSNSAQFANDGTCTR